jgi:hypothetical protein
MQNLCHAKSVPRSFMSVSVCNYEWLVMCVQTCSFCVNTEHLQTSLWHPQFCHTANNLRCNKIVCLMWGLPAAPHTSGGINMAQPRSNIPKVVYAQMCTCMWSVCMYLVRIFPKRPIHEPKRRDVHKAMSGQARCELQTALILHTLCLQAHDTFPNTQTCMGNAHAGFMHRLP